MVLRQRHPIHVGGDQGSRIGCLFDRNAAHECRHLTRHFVQTTKHNVLASWFHSCALEQIREARSTKTSVAHRPALPLNAGNFGIVECTSIPGTFECIDYGMLIEGSKI